MPGGADDYYDEIDESIIVSLSVVALATALAFLMYFRQQRQTNHRRKLKRRQQRVGAAPPVEGQQADGGFFPPPRNPGFGQWVAGGVGH